MLTLKLPKDVVADLRHDAVRNLLTTNTRPLWDDGNIHVPTFPLCLELATECQQAIALGVAFQGLETIVKVLASEQKGLDALLVKSPDRPQQSRVSRLLLVANDGSKRFYRDCDSLLTKYAQRLLGCRLDVTGEVFGTALAGYPKLVRAVLVVDKRAVARALLALS